jgi:hypothetical protein
MVIAPIDERDLDRRAVERARGGQATEAAADHDDAGSARWAGGRTRFPVLVRQRPSGALRARIGRHAFSRDEPTLGLVNRGSGG